MYAHNTVAVTAVPRDTFVNARSVPAWSVHVTAEQIQGARVVDDDCAHRADPHELRIRHGAGYEQRSPSYSFAQRPVVARLNPGGFETERRTPEYTNDSKQFNQPHVNKYPQGGNRANNHPPMVSSRNLRLATGLAGGSQPPLGGRTHTQQSAPAGNRNASAGNLSLANRGIMLNSKLAGSSGRR